MAPSNTCIDVKFSDVPEGSSVQKSNIVTSDGREASFVVGEALEKDGMCVFAGLVSDPFFMDVEATLHTEALGKLSFNTAVNTAQFRDVLSIVVEVPFAPIVNRFNGITIIGRRSREHNHAPRQADPNSNVSGGRRSRTSSWQTQLAIRTRRASSCAISIIAKTPSRSPMYIDHCTSRVSTRTWHSGMVWTARRRGQWDQTGVIRCATCWSAIIWYSISRDRSR